MNRKHIINNKVNWLHVFQVDHAPFHQHRDFNRLFRFNRLIVVDTLQCIRGQYNNKDGGAYGYDYKEMNKLKSFAKKHNLAMLLIHHTSKMDNPNDPMRFILVFMRLSLSSKARYRQLHLFVSYPRNLRPCATTHCSASGGSTTIGMAAPMGMISKH